MVDEEKKMPDGEDVLDKDLIVDASSQFMEEEEVSTNQAPVAANNRRTLPVCSSLRRSGLHKIDFLEDPVEGMTWGRRIALKLINKPWYNPSATGSKQEENEDCKDGLETPNSATTTSSTNTRATKWSLENRYDDNDAYPYSCATRETPSLEKAWAYFEHVALARFVVPHKHGDSAKDWKTRVLHRFQKANRPLDRADPGEVYRPTKLYKPVFTPHRQLGDFGLGVGLYFSTVRALMILTFCAGLLNVYSIDFFASHDYNTQQTDISKRLLQGSAVCTDTTWVLCEDCSGQSKHFSKNRLARGINPSTGDEATFALRNNCEGATYGTGLVSLATLVLLVLGLFLLNKYLKRMAVAFDEDEQTAQDYSVVIANPPGDATDPQEWRQYFKNAFEGAHVTAITIAVDNDLLVRSLVERREVLSRIDQMVEPGTSLDSLNLAGLAAKRERERGFLAIVLGRFLPGLPELFARLVVLTARIQGLAQQDYPARKIFVTFETEAGQRRVLSALNVGTSVIKRNKTNAISNPEHLFRGNLVLDVQEPDEPNTVRWQDLNETWWNRIKQQTFTTFCTLVAIFLIALIVRICNDTSVTFSAFAISLFNIAFPPFAQLLVMLEAHASEGGKQRSLYFKICLFHLVNTAVVITIINPFTVTLENDGGLISQVYALFFAEIVTTNALQLTDPVGHFQRHFQAPRAKTQDAMDLCMQGQDFELAERYTNMTRLLFLCVWYCAIYPAAFFMCSFALFIVYFVDRFSLMRTWKRAPSLGPRMSELLRRHFFRFAILAMAVLSSYYWAGFPFDNLCPHTRNQAGDELAGTWMVQNSTVTLDKSDQLFEFCLQDFFRYGYDERKFPFFPKFQREGSEWMTEEQESVTSVWGWATVVVILIVIFKIVHVAYLSLMRSCKGDYKPRGEDQKINFSDVASISAYVPQVESTLFAYPLLACSVTKIDADLLEWTDPDRPLEYYDLTIDAEVLLRGTDVSSKMVFSQIFHWPPPAVEARLLAALRSQREEDGKAANEDSTKTNGS